MFKETIQLIPEIEIAQGLHPYSRLNVVPASTGLLLCGIPWEAGDGGSMVVFEQQPGQRGLVLEGFDVLATLPLSATPDKIVQRVRQVGFDDLLDHDHVGCDPTSHQAFATLLARFGTVLGESIEKARREGYTGPLMPDEVQRIARLYRAEASVASGLTGNGGLKGNPAGVDIFWGQLIRHKPTGEVDYNHRDFRVAWNFTIDPLGRARTGYGMCNDLAAFR